MTGQQQSRRGGRKERPKPPDIVIVSEEFQKRERGRPTDYEARYCEVVEDLGRQGKSRTQIAAFLNVCRNTLSNWEEQHPDFLRAMSRAREYSMAWWEEAGQKGMFFGAMFNDRAWSLQVRNRFPDDYKESRELELSGKGGGPVMINITPDDAEL